MKRYFYDERDDQEENELLNAFKRYRISDPSEKAMPSNFTPNPAPIQNDTMRDASPMICDDTPPIQDGAECSQTSTDTDFVSQVQQVEDGSEESLPSMSGSPFNPEKIKSISLAPGIELPLYKSIKEKGYISLFRKKRGRKKRTILFIQN